MLAKPSQYPVKVFETVDSTQDEARRQIESGQSAPFWVLAHEQTKGRGRGGRPWQSQCGNYSGSFIYPLPKNKADAPKFSLVTAYALLNSLEHVGLSDLSVKWPNDVLVQERKIAGILLEAEYDYLIIGTGVNLSIPPSPDGLENRAVAPAFLGEFTNLGFMDWHEIYSRYLSEAIQQFETHGLDPIRRTIRSKLLVREEMIFDDGRAEKLIRAKDIGDNGQLIVELDGQRKEIYAGDLWFKD